MTRERMFDAYQRQAWLTANTKDDDPKARLPNWCMGLAGEVGELVDEIKKYVYHGKRMDDMKVLSELGDVLWYLTTLATDLGYYMSDVAGYNMEKLAERHGDSFKPHDKQNR